MQYNGAATAWLEVRAKLDGGRCFVRRRISGDHGRLSA